MMAMATMTTLQGSGSGIGLSDRIRESDLGMGFMDRIQESDSGMGLRSRILGSVSCGIYVGCHAAYYSRWVYVV